MVKKYTRYMYINDPLTANRGQTRTHTQLYAPEARLEEIVGTGLDVDVARVLTRRARSLLRAAAAASMMYLHVTQLAETCFSEISRRGLQSPRVRDLSTVRVDSRSSSLDRHRVSRLMSHHSVSLSVRSQACES